MSSKVITLAGAVVLAALTTTAASAQPAEWTGRYVWEENVGRHGGTTPRDSITAFITYTLSIGPGNGSTGCRLNGEGLQTNKQIQCTVTPRGAAIIVKFYRYGPDNMFNDGYRPGQALFTLTRTPRGLSTALQGLSASSRTTPRTGKLFRRVG